MNAVLQEPAPNWPEAPRLCPQCPFPAYRYVQGMNRHPARESESCGVLPAPALLPPEQWRDSEAYLYGIDLYHHGFLWESHEAWESLWRRLPRAHPQARFLQGLIRNSAAQIKAHAGSARGVHVHSTNARALLASVQDSENVSPTGRFMGMSIPDLLCQIDRHYAPVWRQGQTERPVLDGPAPRLEVS